MAGKMWKGMGIKLEKQKGQISSSEGSVFSSACFGKPLGGSQQRNDI